MIALTPAERHAVARRARFHEQWLYQCLTRRKRAPAERCPAIELAADGRIAVEQLRPDVRWTRVPDPAWPHPEGRPCIDPAGPGGAALSLATDAPSGAQEMRDAA